METFPKSGIKSKKRKAVSEGETTTAVAAKKTLKLIILYSLALSKTYFSNRHTIVVKLKRSLWFTNLVFSSFKWNRFNCWINFSFCSFARVFLWKCSLALIHRAIVLNFSYLLPKLLFIFLFRKFFQTIAHTQTHTDRHSLKPYRCTYFFSWLGLLVDLLHFFVICLAICNTNI